MTKRSGTRLLVVVGIVLSLSWPSTSVAADDHPDGSGESDRRGVGVLIVDHGEPPEYNQFTYWSFRKFFNHLIEMGLIPSWLKLVDAGTVLQNESCYGCDSPATDPHLIDAWLRPHDVVAVHVPASDRTAAHYLIPGGPGLGEPDIFEHVGLAAWNEWQLMGGRSPNFDQKLPKKLAVIEELKRRYGADLPIRIGYGIDPRIEGGRQGIREAVTALVNRDRVGRIVVAYHGVGFSDIMQTHMLRSEVDDVVESLGQPVKLTFSKPIGTRSSYVRAVVNKVAQEVSQLPNDAPVALHLSGHGLPTSKCGEYDCGADAYHAFSLRLFERTKKAIQRAIHRPGRIGIFHLYGDGATEEDDPEDEIDSPIEALNKRHAAEFRYVIDIPYEFDSDSRDTLIVLRRGYEREIPDWNGSYVSHFTYRGMHVKITTSSFGAQLKVRAFEEVIRAAIEGAGEGGGHEH